MAEYDIGMASKEGEGGRRGNFLHFSQKAKEQRIQEIPLPPEWFAVMKERKI